MRTTLGGVSSASCIRYFLSKLPRFLTEVNATEFWAEPYKSVIPIGSRALTLTVVTDDTTDWLAKGRFWNATFHDVGKPSAIIPSMNLKSVKINDEFKLDTKKTKLKVPFLRLRDMSDRTLGYFPLTAIFSKWSDFRAIVASVTNLSDDLPDDMIEDLFRLDMNASYIYTAETARHKKNCKSIKRYKSYLKTTYKDRREPRLTDHWTRMNTINPTGTNDTKRLTRWLKEIDPLFILPSPSELAVKGLLDDASVEKCFPKEGRSFFTFVKELGKASSRQQLSHVYEMYQPHTFTWCRVLVKAARDPLELLKLWGIAQKYESSFSIQKNP